MEIKNIFNKLADVSNISQKRTASKLLAILIIGMLLEIVIAIHMNGEDFWAPMWIMAFEVFTIILLELFSVITFIFLYLKTENSRLILPFALNSSVIMLIILTIFFDVLFRGIIDFEIFYFMRYIFQMLKVIALFYAIILIYRLRSSQK